MNTNVQTAYAQKIKAEYSPAQATKLDELKRLDKKVKLPAKIAAYSVGAAGTLVFGTGMCLCLKVIGNFFALGVVAGCAGIALCVASYFIYKAILKARKKKYGEKIVELSGELLNETDAAEACGNL